MFDLQFHPRNASLLATASSAGAVALFSIDPAATSSDGGAVQPSIVRLWTISVHDQPASVPALFLAWIPEHWLIDPADDGGNNTRADGFAVAFADGRTALFGSSRGLAEAADLQKLGVFEAKQPIEVWFVALAALPDLERSSTCSPSSWTPFMFTGDDFGSLHTLRFSGSRREEQDGTSEERCRRLSLHLEAEFDDRARHHTAGVTSILPLPSSQPLADSGAPVLLTGSYDEFLRVYHATRRGAVLAETRLGGGVWRLQFLRMELDQQLRGRRDDPCPSCIVSTFLVLASCMHAGARVVRITWRRRQLQHSQHNEQIKESELEAAEVGEWSIEVVAEFTEHESMNYASDVWKGAGHVGVGGASDKVLCLSSSFYDKRLCLWQLEL